MRGIIIAVVVGIIGLSYFQYSNAVETVVECQPNVDTSIGYGNIVQCSIDSIGDTDAIRFQARAGDAIVATVKKFSGDGIPHFQLFAPDGTLIVNFTTFSQVTLDQTGPHTILVFDVGEDQTVDYALTLERMAPPSPTTRQIRYSETLNDSINPQVDVDPFSFEATTGDVVTVTITKLASDGIPHFQLFAPDGTLIVNFTTFSQVTLDQTGPHTILVFDVGEDQTVDYALTLQCVVGLCTSPPPPPPPPSCTEQFGSAPGFRLCGETQTTCSFNATTDGGTCEEMCSSLGSTCVGAVDNHGASCVEVIGSNDTCQTRRQTEICECRLPITSETLWLEDFESYQVGTFPPAWNNNGNKDAFVIDTMSTAGNQSLRLFGVIGSCWGAAAHRKIELTEPLEIEFYVANGSENLSGCHPNYGGIELSTGPSWVYNHRGLIKFTRNGEIRGGAFDVDEGEGLYLGNFSPGVWYKVRIRYEVLDLATIRLSFWINDEFRGQQDLPSKSFEEGFSYIGLWAGEGTAWFDNIRQVLLK